VDYLAVRVVEQVPVAQQEVLVILQIQAHLKEVTVVLALFL
jgi:hypothetical protein